MNASFEMFLLAAEELNFSKAAERAFISQQALSDHIRRLEEMYRVRLFERRPRLRLTPEGQAMLRHLSALRVMEHNLANELSDINEGIRGTIHVGLSATRGSIIVPRFMPEYQKEYPKADIQIQLNDTRWLEQLLIRDRLDLFLGVDASENVLFEKTPVCEEPLYLIISDALLRERFGPRCDGLTAQFREGADLSLFQDIPFVQGHATSTTTSAIRQFLLEHHVELKIPICVSNFDIIIDLCRTGLYATVSSAFHLIRLLEEGPVPEGKRMHIFPIKGMTKTLSIEIVEHRDAQRLQYLERFKEGLRAFLVQENDRLSQRLRDYISTDADAKTGLRP